MDERAGRFARLGWVAALVGAAVLGCGAPEGAAPSGRSMAASAAATAAAAPTATNGAPRVLRVTLDPRDPVQGDVLSAHVLAEDPEGDALRFRHRWEAEGVVLPETGPSLRVELPRGARISVSVWASDGRSESEPASIWTRVANRPPEILEVALEPGDQVEANGTLVASAQARDLDGDDVELRYAWYVNDRRVDATGPSFEAAGLRRGDRIHLRLVASDGESDSEAVETPAIPVANQPPRIVSAPGDLGPDGVFRYQIEATDPDGDRMLRYRLEQGPDGMRVDPVLGEVTWHPGAADAGDHAVRIAVNDPHGGEGQQQFELTVRAVETAAVPANAEP